MSHFLPFVCQRLFGSDPVTSFISLSQQLLKICPEVPLSTTLTTVQIKRLLSQRFVPLTRWELYCVSLSKKWRLHEYEKEKPTDAQSRRLAALLPYIRQVREPHIA